MFSKPNALSRILQRSTRGRKGNSMPTIIGKEKRLDIANRYWNSCDKVSHKQITFYKLDGKIFMLVGGLTLFMYGLSLVMDKDTYIRKFSWVPNSGDKIFQTIKSQFCSNRLLNIAWTAPSIMIAGGLLERKYGSVFALKVILLTTFFGIAAFSLFGGMFMPFERSWVC
jgi:hypothetical protein